MFPHKKVQSLVGTRIQVEMKGENSLLEGILASFDDYLNLYLHKAKEVINGETSRTLGSVILRGNNIVLINPLKEE